MKKRLILIYSLLFALASVSRLHAMAFPLNTIRYYDLRYWAYDYDPCTKVDVGLYAVDYYDIHGRDLFGEKVNILQIWNPDQPVLAAIKGFKPTTPIGQIAAQLNDVNDDGRRGHLVPTAGLDIQEYGLGVRYHMPHGLIFGTYLPIYDMHLRDIQWADATQDVTFGDLLLKDLITDHLAETILELSNGLNIENNWHRAGLGDLTCLLQWISNFPQAKPVLNNVLLNLRLGASFPTGKRSALDDVFSIPFGYQGAFGLAFGGNVELTWKKYFLGGIDTDFRYLFPSTAVRRINTDTTQTDLLLLASALTRLDQGIVQRMNVYGGIRNFFPGLILDLGYQFQKQAESRLTLFNDAIAQFYVNAYANEAQRLQEWTLHQFWLILRYTYRPEKEWIFPAPTVSLIWNHTFKGRQALMNKQLGISVSIAY